MKMAFYIDSLQLGGAERVMANLCNRFNEIGNDVLLINDMKSSDTIKEYTLNQSIKRVYIANDNKGEVLKYNINRLRRLRKNIKEFAPDIIISFLGPPNIRMLLSTIGLKTKRIVSVRNDPYQEYGKRIKRIITNLVFLLSDGYVFQTDEAKAYFLKTIQKKGKVIFNPVNKDFFCTPDRRVEKKEIVVIGRLQKQKNPSMVIHAFNKIKEKYKDYKIIYLGAGELKEDIQRIIGIYELQDNVSFEGQVLSVYERLVSASLYVLSSDFEGMPNALMEAMAIGVPIIATDCPCGGPRTLIKNSNQGILISCGDVNALANAIDKVLSNDILRNTMRIESSNRAKEFHPDEIFKHWEEYIYKE